MSNQNARTAPKPPPADLIFEPITLDVGDDEPVPIAARFYPARTTAPRGAVLIVSAMGVPQTFYAAFATWLAGEGFPTVTFDYRGIAASRTTPMRRVAADLVTWAELDTAAALRLLEARAPGLPITWIGHSLGGQIVPLVPGAERIAKLITAGTGSGYWRENAEPLRRKVWLFWFGLVPLLTPLFGYFPGRRLGMVGDLPRGVIRQWRRWCLDREYAVGAEGPAMRAKFAAVTAPITSLWFTDDEMMSDANVTSIHGFYTGAPRAMHRLVPRALGLARVGHFGLFRAEMRAPLWEAIVRGELAQLPVDR